MATIHLTQEERDSLSKHLNENQQKFIDLYLKRGRKTIFANVLARGKASSIKDSSIEKVASQWELQDYIDAGPNWRTSPTLYCECGRMLRYQYVVLNKETSEVKKFGITHFEEHVGIPAELVKEIIAGIASIDYERDEMVIKIADQWTLADESIHEIPPGLEIPKDIQFHFDYEVPLLDRQINRLKGIITTYRKQQERLRLEHIAEEQEAAKSRKEKELRQRREKLLKERGWNNQLDLTPALQAGVMMYIDDLNHPEFLASAICKYLVDYHDASDETLSSGNYKIFPHVCIYLEQLVREEQLEFLGRKDGIDRIYKLS